MKWFYEISIPIIVALYILFSALIADNKTQLTLWHPFLFAFLGCVWLIVRGIARYELHSNKLREIKHEVLSDEEAEVIAAIRKQVQSNKF